MRIVSWNVNGLQTTLKDATHRFTNISKYFTTILKADIVCFQEAKIQEEKLEKWMACVPGFESFWAFSQAKKGYSGVVTYVKNDFSPLDAAAEKLPGDIDAVEGLCREGRIIETDHGSFVLVNVYVPNAGDRDEGRPRLDFKIRFLQALKGKCDDLVSLGRHVVVVGDFNIAHKAIDVHKKWNTEEIYSSEEHAWLDNFLTEYVDLFRHFHPDVKDVYSVWEAKTDARIHNEGLRIDYAVCDKGFLSQVKDTQILKMIPKNWSDHAAVVLTLQEQPALPPHPSPSISSRNMERFQDDRRQKKLTSLFSRGASKPMTASNIENNSSIQDGNPQQGNSSTSSLVRPNSGESGPKTSSGPLDELEKSAEWQQEVAPETVSSNDGPQATKDEPFVEAVCKAPGSNGNLGGQFSTSNADDLDGSQALQKTIISSEQPDDSESRMVAQPKHDEAKVDGLDPTNDASQSGSEPGSDVMVIANTEESSLHKRKQPSTPLIEPGGVAGKQRSMTSYFKVDVRGRGATAEDPST
ncbi:unnamed protein product [Calypogeia fissa]